MRVLLAPANTAGQPWGMAQGLRALGHEAEVWEVGPTRFRYPADRTLPVPTDTRQALAFVSEAVAGGFDVVHFHFARTLVGTAGGLPWFWDLPVWAALGARIVLTFHGSDIRLRSHHLATDEWSFYRYADIPCDEDLVAARLEVLLAYADATTVGSVLDLPYVPGAVVVPKVVDLAGLPDAPLAGTAAGRPPVVAHAPSLRATKGTDMILAGLDRLRARGVEFELDLVEGVTHGEALARMARADVVVEKLLGGDAGMTSLEAMAMGKVAVARIRPEVRAHAPDVPVVDADPTTFVDVMADLLAAPERLASLGTRGREHVTRHHAPAVVAERLVGLYRVRRPHAPVVPPGWTAPDIATRLHDAERRVAELEAENRRLRRRLAAARPDLLARTLARRAAARGARLRGRLRGRGD